MRAYIYDVQRENKHCLGRHSNLFPEVEADRNLLHQITFELTEANIISDTNLVTNKNITEELLLGNNPR